MKDEIELRDGYEVVGVVVMTSFVVLFPLSAIVYAGIACMINIAFPVWATIILGLLMFAIAVVIWLAIIGAILGRKGGKG
ncbi:hypothetical protein ES704_01380 [subsurface metagenome]|jgi:hypothetical protein